MQFVVFIQNVFPVMHVQCRDVLDIVYIPVYISAASSWGRPPWAPCWLPDAAQVLLGSATAPPRTLSCSRMIPLDTTYARGWVQYGVIVKRPRQIPMLEWTPPHPGKQISICKLTCQGRVICILPAHVRAHPHIEAQYWNHRKYWCHFLRR